MSKYFEIAKVYLKVKLTWRLDILFQVIFSISKIVFAYLLWGMIFNGRDTYSGFTFPAILSYYLISNVIAKLDNSDEISWELCNGVRRGTFSKYMVLPVNVEYYMDAMAFGKMMSTAAFNIFAAMIWFFLFRIPFLFTSDRANIVCGIALIGLGLLFMMQFNFLLGLLTFQFQDISAILMIKNNLLAFITGSIIPLALLPDKVVQIMKLLPFYYIRYIPSMLFIGRCEDEKLVGVVVLACWCIMLFIVNRSIYRQNRIKYDGVGI